MFFNFQSSPPPFSPEGRTNDIDGLIHCIEKAEKFVYISVMDYFPLTIYTPKVKYWPVIDDALKKAAIERKVSVRLLVSKWKHSRKSEDYFLKALEDLTNSYNKVNIEVVGTSTIYSTDITRTVYLLFARGYIRNASSTCLYRGALVTQTREVSRRRFIARHVRQCIGEDLVLTGCVCG